MIQDSTIKAQRKKKGVWITVGSLFFVAALIYFAFIGRGVFGWFA